MADAEKAPKVDRFAGLSESLADEIRKDEIEYFKTDLPVPYGEFLLYPVTVRDYEKFASASACLTLDKNQSAEGIKMTNLDFLVSKLTDEEEGKVWSYRLHTLIEVVFHVKNGLKCKECGKVVEYQSKQFSDFVSKINEILANPPKNGEPFEEPKLVCAGCGNGDIEKYSEVIKIVKDDKGRSSLVIDGKTMDSRAFNDVRKLIMYQNFADYRDDSYVDPDIKKDYEERLALEEKASNGAKASLERKIVGLSVAAGYRFEDIYDMTIRKFAIALGMVDDLINYKITKSAMMGGMASFPKGFKLEHWLYKPEKDMYGDGYKTTDQAQQFSER